MGLLVGDEGRREREGGRERDRQRQRSKSSCVIPTIFGHQSFNSIHYLEIMSDIRAQSQKTVVPSDAGCESRRPQSLLPAGCKHWVPSVLVIYDLVIYENDSQNAGQSYTYFVVKDTSQESQMVDRGC